MARVRLVAIGIVPLVHDQPAAGRWCVMRDALRHERRQVCECERTTVEIADIQINDIEWMYVGVDEPRQHQPACEVLAPRPGTYPALRTGLRPDEHSGSGPARERARDRASRVRGIDPASLETQG